MWLKFIVFIISFLLLCGAGIRFYGQSHWDSGTQELRNRLQSARAPSEIRRVNFSELAELPEPVQRYFFAVLQEGQPLVAAASVRHKGSFNTAVGTQQWKPFTSEQLVITRRPGFDWNAKVFMLPGVPVHVHDAYENGEGLLHAAILGLFTVAEIRGTVELARGELMRFFAEAAWYPTALLPSQGVRWEPVDANSARGTLTDGALAITLLFSFDKHDLIETVRAETRGRLVDGKTVPTPWQGHFSNYQERKNMRVPLDGEVEWLLPQGPAPYWRGHITEIDHELFN